MNRHLRAWYRDKRVFVTGHTGFKGAWLSAWLQDAGATVVGYALAPEPNSLFRTAGLGADMRSIQGDVRDPEALGRSLVAAAPDIVFHMAAQSLVRRSYADPVGTYAINVMGTVHLLAAVRRAASVRSVVIVTSDKCYENQGLSRGYREDDPMGGHDPYSSSKACAEIATAALARSYFASGSAAVASARAGNVVGGGDWAEDRLVPDLMRAAAGGAAALIRNPDSVRPWQFVLEPLHGYLTLGRRLAEDGAAFAGAWNFGPRAGTAVTVREMVTRVARAWDRVQVTFAAEASGPHEARSLQLDSGKAAARLGWEPALTLDQTVTTTTNWYREAYENRTSPGELLRRQLRAYERRVDAVEEAA